ncbi:carbon monoxide dehydrogenase, partial [Candidatus Aerophobetes bacterium]
MKIAVTGKGGTGKTTLSAGLATLLVSEGKKVFAIDADPDANLALTLGHPNPRSIKPLIELKELIEERTGAKIG